MECSIKPIAQYDINPLSDQNRVSWNDRLSETFSDAGKLLIAKEDRIIIAKEDRIRANDGVSVIR